MKHWFIINSPITYLVARKTIDYLGLDTNDCMLLTTRGYVGDDPKLQSVDLWFLTFPTEGFPDDAPVWQMRRKVLECDRWITKRCGGHSFHLYVPHTRNKAIRLLMSHRHCREFSIIEEGAAAYYSPRDIELIHPIGGRLPIRRRMKHWLRFGSRIPQQPRFFDPGYKTIYAIHEASFKSYPRRVILGLPFRVQEYQESYFAVLIMSSFVDRNAVPEEAYIAVIERLLEHLIAQQVETLHVKHHPNQSVERGFRNRVDALFKRYREHLHIVILGDDAILEEIAFNVPSTFYSTGSSTDLYATFCDRQVYCFAKWLEEVGIEREVVMRRFSPFHRDRVTWL